MRSSMRINTATSFERTSRPMSSYTFHPREVPYVINTHRTFDGHRLYTIQSQSKGMGAQMEKEELYEQNMHLKKRNNKLKSELDEARSTIVKKDIELRKKDKLIEDLSKENVQIVHEENVCKAKDSTLVTLIKRKYYELKSEYDGVVKENELLKANVKLTKIKEIKIETDILQQEYAKMKQLYTHMQEQNKCSLNEITQLKAFQHEYLKQHQLICTLRDNYEHSKDECKRSIAEINKLKDKLSHKETLNKKLMLQHQKLQTVNERLLNEKKQREKNVLSQYDYQKKLAETTRMLSIYKMESAQNQTTHHTNALTSQHVLNNNNNYINTRLQEDMMYKDNQLRTYRDIITDMDTKVSIYEKYITNKGDNPLKVLKSGGYNGTINAKTLKQTQDLMGSLNSNKTSSNSEPSQPSVEHYKIPFDEVDKNYFKDTKNVFKLFKITFESNNITAEYLTNALNDIYSQFDGKEETSREEFLKPFIDLFIQCSQTTHQKEIEFISTFLNTHLDANDNETDKFITSIQEFNETVKDYSTVYNEKDLLRELEREFSFCKSDVLKYLNENSSKDNHSYVDFIMFDHIIKNKIGLKINNELFDYALYKMRSSLPKGSSMFLLDTQFVKLLLSGKGDELLSHKHSHKSSSNHHEGDINKQTHITEENEKEGSSCGSEFNKARINDDSQERFDVEVNKSESLKDSGRVLEVMKDNAIDVDTFFEEDIQIDNDDDNNNETTMKMIHKDKFFKRLNTLNVELTPKEMNDFIKTYHITTNKSMLNVDQIKEDLNNNNNI